MRRSRDSVYMEMAGVIAQRSTCARRSVGCILVNRRGTVLSVGYNGAPMGFSHCIDTPCPGASADSGQDLSLCVAIHAEQNALLQCANVMDIWACYSTTMPCMHCIKLLANTSCTRILYQEPYAYPETTVAFWEKMPGRTIRQFSV